MSLLSTQPPSLLSGLHPIGCWYSNHSVTSPERLYQPSTNGNSASGPVDSTYGHTLIFGINKCWSWFVVFWFLFVCCPCLLAENKEVWMKSELNPDLLISEPSNTPQGHFNSSAFTFCLFVAAGWRLWCSSFSKQLHTFTNRSAKTLLAGKTDLK